MESVRSWDKAAAGTLWAKWTVRVKLGKNGGTGGDDYVTVIYGQPFPTRAMPTRSGYAFGGYFVSASAKTGQCYNPDGTGTSTMKWTTGGTPTVWALWTAPKSAKSVRAPRASASVAPSAPLAQPVADDESGYCAGRLADDSGAYELIVDEGLETGYVRIVFDSGESFAAEVDVLFADGAILVMAEDGEAYELSM